MRSDPPHRRRTLLASLAGCTLVGGVLSGAAGLSPAIADQPAGSLVTGASTAIAGATSGADGTAVTLITGDVAYLNGLASGHPGVVVRDADGGAAEEVYTRVIGDDVYTIPVDALDDVSSGRLDEELFNVTSLVRQGYDDAGRATLPLIVRHGAPVTDVARGVTVGVGLASIDAAAVTVDKAEASDALKALLASGADTRIELDAQVATTAVETTSAAPAAAPAAATSDGLDPRTGVSQTGAPQAWDAGYTGAGVTVAVLDTGWDSQHPDLVHRVVDAKDFTGSGSTADAVGHGTHVAGTIVGDGSADAADKGMAPGARLLVGKVLGPNGGAQSGIIAGMEWAVAQGAKVVNMSLGSQVPQPCDDPVADAVSRLGDKALFVISAGNLSTRTSVSSPGCAEKALTVGAVDSSGAVADFSSRGAVIGDHRVKPDVSAPGVGILSAWAGRPGGVMYRAMSGTSMAAPHVTGAVALVAQAHPDWSAAQLKRALAGSVKGDETSTVYEEGSGELWVPGAIASKVTSDVSVSVGTFDWPHGKDEHASTTVRYANSGGEPVHVSLRVDDVEGADGVHLPSSIIRVSPSSVKIPAGGSVDVTVSARGDVGTFAPDAFGEISARILASRGGTSMTTTAVGMWLAPQTTDVAFEVIDRNGKPATAGLLDVVDRQSPARAVRSLTGAVQKDSLRVGTYSVGAYVRTTVDGATTWTYVSQPELAITGDTTKVTLDARTATEISVDTPKAMKVVASQFGTDLTWDRWKIQSSMTTGTARLYVTPTAKVKDSTFGFAVSLRGVDPSTSVSKSPYVYNLAFVDSQRIGADQHHRVKAGDLATVTESWHGELGPISMSESLAVTPAGWQGPLTGATVAVDGPAERTAYYTPGVAWRQSASEVGSFPTALWTDPQRTYAAGQASSIGWFALRTRTGTAYAADGSPAAVAQRQGSLIGFSFPQWQDAVAGRSAIAGLGEAGNTTLWLDGALVGTVAFPYVQADIGAGTHDVKVRAILTKLPRFGVAKLSSASFTTFSFRTAQPAGGEVAALPLAFPRYDAPVDQLNRAPQDAAFPITIGAVGQAGYDPGTWTSLKVRMTSKKLTWSATSLPESDGSWVDVPVEQRDGKWVALVDQSQVAAGSTVSIAVDGTDAHGTRVEQYLLDLYQVR